MSARDGSESWRRGRKQDTTLANYESDIRCHFVPHFAEAPIAEIGEDDIAGFIDACLNLNDLSVKTVRNLYVHLNAIFEFAVRKRGCHANPCKLVDKPRRSRTTISRSASSTRRSSMPCSRCRHRPPQQAHARARRHSASATRPRAAAVEGHR
jgi:hypothetical protein